MNSVRAISVFREAHSDSTFTMFKGKCFVGESVSLKVVENWPTSANVCWALM
ncbi:MAG: hypothetical protein ACJAU0_000795 [Flavobacteriales bacterium]|jgi:hypothetical protein